MASLPIRISQRYANGKHRNTEDRLECHQFCVYTERLLAKNKINFLPISYRNAKWFLKKFFFQHLNTVIIKKDKTSPVHNYMYVRVKITVNIYDYMFTHTCLHVCTVGMHNMYDYIYTTKIHTFVCPPNIS